MFSEVVYSGGGGGGDCHEQDGAKSRQPLWLPYLVVSLLTGMLGSTRRHTHDVVYSA